MADCEHTLSNLASDWLLLHKIWFSHPDHNLSLLITLPVDNLALVIKHSTDYKARYNPARFLYIGDYGYFLS